MSTPTLARPVFSTEDFRLVRRAVEHYLRTADADPQMAKFSNLHHRLGRYG